MWSKEGDVNLPYQREDLWQHGHLGDGQWLQEMLELRSCCLEFEKYKSCWCHYCSDLADLTFPCLFQITPFKDRMREREIQPRSHLLVLNLSPFNQPLGFPGGTGGKEWQPTPVFLPGESHGQRSHGLLMGYGPWGHKESDTTEATQHSTQPAINPSLEKWVTKKQCLNSL